MNTDHPCDQCPKNIMDDAGPLVERLDPSEVLDLMSWLCRDCQHCQN